MSGGGGKTKKNPKGYMETLFDDITGKTHKDLMRQINSLHRSSF
jgi:hypothetical protein